MISFKPSMICSNTSIETWPIFFPNLNIDNVLIKLRLRQCLYHHFFDSSMTSTLGFGLKTKKTSGSFLLLTILENLTIVV